MPGHRDRHERNHEERSGILSDRLRLMFEWYKGTVDESTGRLLYLYDPEKDVTIGDGEPIRDIGSIWDVEVLSVFLGRDDLSKVTSSHRRNSKTLLLFRHFHSSQRQRKSLNADARGIGYCVRNCRSHWDRTRLASAG